MAHLPQAVPVLNRRGPVEMRPAHLCHDLTKALRILSGRGGGAVEFHHQMRLFRQAGAVLRVEDGRRRFIHELDPCHGNAHLDRRHHRVHRRLERIEGADGGGDRLGLAMKFQRQFGDKAQRPFRSDEKPGQVIAGCGFARAGPGADHAAIGQHHLKRHDVVAHRPVANGGGAGCAGGGHAPERGIGTGVDGEHQAGRAQFGIQRLARQAGLDDGLKIAGAHRKDAVHAAEIDAKPAMKGNRVALKRCPSAPADHRQAVAGADRDQGRDLRRRFGEGDGIGGHGGEPGFIPAMFGEIPRRTAEARAKKGLKFGKGRVARHGSASAEIGEDRRGVAGGRELDMVKLRAVADKRDREDRVIAGAHLHRLAVQAVLDGQGDATRFDGQEQTEIEGDGV